MDALGPILAVLIALGFAFMFGPRVLHANRGKVLQNIALWLGIILVLALFYKFYGPGAQIPKQDSAIQTPPNISENSTPEDKDDSPESLEPTITEDQGFMPPREE